MTARNEHTTWTPTRFLVYASPVLLLVLWFLTPSDAGFKQPATWQHLTEPGALSFAHAHLERDCAACHSPVKGVETAKCIACHANNESLLQRQPTAFHAGISSCTECHLEHQGLNHNPTHMDHRALVPIGLRQINAASITGDRTAGGGKVTQLNPSFWTNSTRSPHLRISALEAALNCNTCHANDDRHFRLFGRDCAQCHATDRWSIPEFRHPSVVSTDCAQCHQAPPSHYMMHFSMISARVAGKPRARVDQCFQCHETTSWNDILGVGWYKHH